VAGGLFRPLSDHLIHRDRDADMNNPLNTPVVGLSGLLKIDGLPDHENDIGTKALHDGQIGSYRG